MAKKNKLAYGGKAARVADLINRSAKTNAEIAKIVGCHPNYVYTIRRKMIGVVEVPEGISEEAVKEVAYQATRGRQAREAENTKIAETKPNEVDKVLDTRADQYGSFMQSADTAIKIKSVMHNAVARNDLHLYPDQLLALDMIAVKISRIVNGDPNYADSWLDIAGYAKLVADRLNGKVR